MYKSELVDFLNAEFRDIKLHIVTYGEFQLKINLSKLRKGNNFLLSQKYWSILNQWKGKSTISGSCSLYAFGLINRLPNDIDLLVNKNDFNPGRKLSHNRYPGMDGKMDVLGYYMDRGYNVDFFDSINHSFIECDGLLFHHPFEVIQKKIEIITQREKRNYKDFYDICEVFKSINPEYTNSLLLK